MKPPVYVPLFRYNAILHSLELIVDKIAIIATALNDPGTSVEDCVVLETDMHEAVSMTLADSLRLLLEHGLLEGGDSVGLEGGCVPSWRRNGKKRQSECAAWKVFKHYYDLKVSSLREDSMLEVETVVMQWFDNMY